MSNALATASRIAFHDFNDRLVNRANRRASYSNTPGSFDFHA